MAEDPENTSRMISLALVTPTSRVHIHTRSRLLDCTTYQVRIDYDTVHLHSTRNLHYVSIRRFASGYKSYFVDIPAKLSYLLLDRHTLLPSQTPHSWLIEFTKGS